MPLAMRFALVMVEHIVIGLHGFYAAFDEPGEALQIARKHSSVGRTHCSYMPSGHASSATRARP